MNQQEAIQVLHPQWEGGYWAKSSGELLWAHHYAVWNVANKLSKFSNSITADKQRLLELACLTHDIRKMTDKKCQSRLQSGNPPGDHKLHLEDLEQYFRELSRDEISVSDNEIRQVWDIARTHHSVAEHDLEVQQSVDVDLFVLLRVSDWMASMEQPDFETISRIQQKLGRVVRLTYFHFSRFASPTSCLAVKVALDAYRKGGWEPLVVFGNGCVLTGNSNCRLPDRREVSSSIETHIIKGSIAHQTALPTRYSTDFLTMLPKQYPHLYMEANGKRIASALGDVSKRQLVFLKLARDLMNAYGLIKPSVTEQCPVLSIVNSANSQGGTNAAKQKFTKAFGEPPPTSVNREFLDSLFERATFSDVLPPEIPVGVRRDQELTSASPDDLLSALNSIVETSRPESGNDGLRNLIHRLTAMEEEIDFGSFAREVFEKYKSYKRTSSAKRGVCERCGSPVAEPMQSKGMNLVESGQSFSQIKPKATVNRAICPLCVYDNLVVRHELRSGDSYVFARVESKIADLLDHIEPLQRLVTRIESGLRYPRDLAKLQEIEGCQNLPFPTRLRIPVRDVNEERDPATTIRLNDRGVLIQIAQTNASRGPRDLRGQYEPVYHVLRFLGYQVAVGTEEQDGLFGKPVPTTETNYLRSLAVILLADQVDKKSNKYVYASELLSRSPSVALTYAAGDGRERFGMKQKLLVVFLKYLVQGQEVGPQQKGEYRMKHLLEDAAFLSPHWVERTKGKNAQSLDEAEETFQARAGAMWEFCDDVGRVGTRYRKASEITKHSATKPISQALDQLMLGRGVDLALNKFMQNLATEAYIDSKEVTRFVGGVRGVLDNAEKLRKNNVTDFLRYKNGLLSAVFMFTRYPDLKSVVTSEKE